MYLVFNTLKSLVMNANHSSIFNIKNHDTKPVSTTNVGGFLNAIFNKIFTTTLDLNKDPIIIYSSKDHLKVDVKKSFLSTFQNSIYEVVKSRTLASNIFLDESELVFMTDILYEHGTIKDYVVSLKTKTQEIRVVIFSAQIEIVNNKPYIRCALKKPVIN